MCAKIYPAKQYIAGMQKSEELVYDALSKLDDDYVIFYSVHWLLNNRKFACTWKENDFVIFHRKYGGLILEVKGGGISFKDGCLFQINRKTGEIKELSKGYNGNDPLCQGIAGKYHYRNLITDKLGKSIANMFPIETAVWFPAFNVRNNKALFPEEYQELKEAILGEEAFDNVPKKIEKAFSCYNNGGSKVDASTFNKIVALIAKDFCLVESHSYKHRVLDYDFVRLTNEQFVVLDYIAEQKTATIQGVAGTGKTLIAKEAASKFAADGRRVLFLCFNSFLCEYLKEQYACDNVEYYNINKFISSMGILDDTSDAKKRYEALKKIQNPDMYDDIIIDEAQDLSNDEIKYFKDIMEMKDGHFIVFYDKNQLVMSDEIPEWVAKSECKLLLTRNCRNTEQIALTACNVINKHLNQKISMITGDTTSLFISKNPVIKLEEIIEYLIDKKEYKLSDITVLTLKTEEKSFLNGIKKLGKISISHKRNDTGLLFTTARKFKGLESRCIVIIDISADSFKNDEEMRLFYVASSRATQKLMLLIDADDKEINNIADIISKNKRQSPIKRIKNRTKSEEGEIK